MDLQTLEIKKKKKKKLFFFFFLIKPLVLMIKKRRGGLSLENHDRLGKKRKKKCKERGKTAVAAGSIKTKKYET